MKHMFGFVLAIFALMLLASTANAASIKSVDHQITKARFSVGPPFAPPGQIKFLRPGSPAWHLKVGHRNYSRDITCRPPTSVPEPGGAWASLVIGAGLLGLRRKFC